MPSFWPADLGWTPGQEDCCGAARGLIASVNCLLSRDGVRTTGFGRHSVQPVALGHGYSQHPVPAVWGPCRGTRSGWVRGAWLGTAGCVHRPVWNMCRGEGHRRPEASLQYSRLD